MITPKNLSFDNWTAYDDWLIANYATNAIYKVNEVNGKIEIEYCDKADFQAEQKRIEDEKEKAAAEARKNEPQQKRPEV